MAKPPMLANVYREDHSAVRRECQVETIPAMAVQRIVICLKPTSSNLTEKKNREQLGSHGNGRAMELRLGREMPHGFRGKVAENVYGVYSVMRPALAGELFAA